MATMNYGLAFERPIEELEERIKRMESAGADTPEHKEDIRLRRRVEDAARVWPSTQRADWH